jgi:hypothetical protein
VQGSGGGVAAGEVVQEELHPAEAGQQEQAGAGGGVRHGRCWSCVREGEHGRRPVPAEGGPQHVPGLPRAPGGHVPPRLLRRWPLGLGRHLRGQGRRPHALRRRALRVSPRSPPPCAYVC